MLDQNFCTVLEYTISEALRCTNNELTKGFWCDGVVMSEPEIYYTQKYINDNRQVVLHAYVGKDGQTVYTLHLQFGAKSLSRYARKLDLTVCIPDNDGAGWFSIDVSRRVIELLLH